LKLFEFSYPNILKGEVRGSFELNSYVAWLDDQVGELSCKVSMEPEQFKIEHLGDSSSYLAISEDKLFPYASQVCISSREVLEEFLSYFVKIIMEQ
jgi:hypothetical protein